MRLDLEVEDLRPLVAEVVEAVFAQRERLEARLPDQLTFSEADGGQWLGLSVAQMRELRYAGRIRPLDGFGRSIRYSRRELLRVAGMED